MSLFWGEGGSLKLSQLALPLKIKPGGGLKTRELRTMSFMKGVYRFHVQTTNLATGRICVIF